MSFPTKLIVCLGTAACLLGLVVGRTNWLLGSNPPNLAVDLSIKPCSQAVALPIACASSSNQLALANAESAEPPTAGQPAPSERPANAFWDFQERSKAVQRIEATLKEQTEISFTDTPLSDVLVYLQDYHNIPILLDTESLNEAGVATDSPVTRTLTGTSLESAINILLAPLKLDYVIANDVMMITTAKQAEATTDARVYDLSRLPNIESKTLSAIIMSVTKPESWTEKGGPGTLVLGMDFIFVNQSQRTHRKIVSILIQLERLAIEQAKRRAVRST